MTKKVLSVAAVLLSVLSFSVASAQVQVDISVRDVTANSGWMLQPSGYVFFPASMEGDQIQIKWEITPCPNSTGLALFGGNFQTFDSVTHQQNTRLSGNINGTFSECGGFESSYLTFSAPEVGVYQMHYTITCETFRFLGQCADVYPIDRTTLPVYVGQKPPTNTAYFNAVDPEELVDGGPITTKISGTTAKLKVGAKDRDDFTGELDIYLLDASTTGGTTKPDSNCDVGWNRIDTIGSGIAYAKSPITIRFNYRDALADGRIEIVATSNNNTTTDSCSTDNFAIRPAYFTVTATDKDQKTPGTDRTLNVTDADGTPIHNAGQPFTLTAIPRRSGGGKTAGYTVGAPQAKATASILSAQTGTVSPGLTVQDGKAVNKNATYSEAGAFKLQVIDPDFAAVDANDGTPYCQRTIGLSWTDGSCTQANPVYAGPAAKVGRFVPDHFSVTVKQSPVFNTFCPIDTSAGSGFTYLKQTLNYATQPVIKIKAENAKGDPTTNYAGIKATSAPAKQFGRLTTASLVSANGSWPKARGTSGGYSETDNSAITTSGHSLDTTMTPGIDQVTIAKKNGSTATLTFPQPKLDVKPFVRTTTTDLPSGEPPFNANISLSLYITDADQVTAATNPFEFNPIKFTSGNQMRYGRAFINSAVGSELLSLSVPMNVQYYKNDDTGFVTNTDDTCTGNVKQSAIQLGPYKAYPGESIAATSIAAFNRPVQAGEFGLVLTAPGASHAETVDITAQVPIWLQYAWHADDPDNFLVDPSGRAAFGIYKGNDYRIFQQEVIGPN
jgi:hypothetical protein